MPDFLQYNARQRTYDLIKWCRRIWEWVRKARRRHNTWTRRGKRRRRWRWKRG